MQLELDWCRYTFDPAYEEPHNRAIFNHFGISNEQIDEMIQDGRSPAFDDVVMLTTCASTKLASSSAAVIYFTIRKSGLMSNCKLFDLDTSGDNAVVEAFNYKNSSDKSIVLVNFMSSLYETVMRREIVELFESELRGAYDLLPNLKI